jgi:hypothetical protein
MARQRDSKLVGTIQNLIFYNHQGDYRMRLKPAYVKRSSASVKSGLNFGRASMAGKQIRQAIYSIIPSKSGNRSMFRFTGALNRMLSRIEKEDPASSFLQKNLPFVNEFQFNDESVTPSVIQPQVKSTGSGLIEIQFPPIVPADSLHAPYSTDHIIFKIIATSTSLAYPETDHTKPAEIRIPYQHDVFQPALLSMHLKNDPGRLILVVVAVEYFVVKKGGISLLTDPKKMPCGVVWAGIQST